MKVKGIESYSEASVEQQNFENNYRKENFLTEEEKARQTLKAELYCLQHKFPNANYDKLYKKLYQFAWIEEIDEIFEGMDLEIDEIVSQEVNNG